MPLIPKMYLYAAAAVIAALLMLAVAYSYRAAYNKGFTAGGDACRAAVSSATAENLAKSQRRILHENKKLQAIEDEINASPKEHDGPLSRVLVDQLGRMRGKPAENKLHGVTRPAP